MSPKSLSCVVLLLSAWSAWGEVLPVIKGNFEEGAETPAGWKAAAPSATWTTEGGRSGRAVRGESNEALAAWTSAPVLLNPNDSAIIEAWIKSEGGEGWFEVRSQDGTETLNQSPQVSGDAWTYTAVELPAGHPGVITFALMVQSGGALFDDMAWRPGTAKIMVNEGFEAELDKKGRVPYWSEEKAPEVMAGTAAGSFAVGADPAREGAKSLAITSSADWYAMASVNYPPPAWAQSFSARVQAQCRPGAEAQLLLLWATDAQKVLRVDKSPATPSADWTELAVDGASPPEGATLMRPVLLVHKTDAAAPAATALFDAVELHPLGAKKPLIKVLVNQAGYLLHGPKTATILTSFFPDAGAGEFALKTEQGEEVLRAPLVAQGRMFGQNDADWGWYFWRADFSDVDKPGTYSVGAKVGGATADSYAFTLSEDQLFDATGHLNVDFFFVQRCGGDVPGWHKPCHLDDAKMEDGSHRDLVGGWHSAGDYNKLVWEYGDGGVMCALITAAEAIPEYFHAKDRDGDGIEDVIEEAQWGADFMKKLMLEDGSLLNHIEQGPDRKTWMNWCPPENTTDNTVGTADDPIVTKGNGNSPLAIAGWARLHRVLTARGIENDYLASAEKLWAKVSNNGANTGDSLLLISTLDLYDVTKNQAYLDYCKASAEALVAQGDPEGQLPGGYSNSGDTPAIALSAFALAFPEDPITQKIKTRLEKHLPFFLKEAQNPLGLMMQQPGPGGYFFEPTSALGCNNQVGMRAWSAVMVYRVLHDQRALRYALDQYDFMLGRNPYGVCMMEGVGSFNPPRQHHRYITIPGHEARGAVPGALVNGFVRDIGSFDRPGMDMSTEGRQYPSYRTNEPWLVHNVLYLLGVTALHEAVEEEAAG